MLDDGQPQADHWQCEKICPALEEKMVPPRVELGTLASQMLGKEVFLISTKL